MPVFNNFSTKFPQNRVKLRYLSKFFLQTEAGHVLKIFLRYPKKRASCSYKLRSLKKKVYTCTCSENAIYIGQTRRACDTRWKEHQRALEKEQWHHSGITQHLQHCQEPFDMNNFEVVHTMQDKKKRRLEYNLRMREAFEIRNHNSGPGKGLNEDNGAYLKTDIWDPVLNSN